MTILAMRRGGPDFGGGRVLRIAAAVIACHRWAYAMQHRYDRLGIRGLRRDDPAFRALTSRLDDAEARGVWSAAAR